MTLPQKVLFGSFSSSPPNIRSHLENHNWKMLKNQLRTFNKNGVSLKQIKGNGKSQFLSATFLNPVRNSSSSSQSQGHLPGHPTSPFLTSLDESFFDSVRANAATTAASSAADKRPGAGIPTYRLMDSTGKLLQGVSEESLEVSSC